MFSQICFPDTIAPDELDQYLQKGWFRMRQSIFTTNFLHIASQTYSVIWLRVALTGYVTSKKQRSLEKLNAGFKTIIQPATYTPEQEVLYQLYRESVSFEVSGTLQDLLWGNETYNRYNTYEVCVYDNDLLIAIGFFDLGNASAAGISCIYHPQYKKYSPGKYLMYQKINFCISYGMQYFYPGYVVPGYKPFDYKATVGTDTLEFLQLETNNWLPYHLFIADINPLVCMIEKLGKLKAYLEHENILSNILFYRFFDAALDPGLQDETLFDYPVFLYGISAREHLNMIVYDVRDGLFHLYQCNTFIHLDYFIFAENFFNAGVLKASYELLVTNSMKDLAEVLPSYL